jgi:Protein of unknown function (DUF3168)
MSGVGKAIYTILSADATLAAIFSNRIFPATVPARTATPYLVYTKISATPTNDKDGPSALDEEYFQIDIYTATYDQNHTAAERVRTLLDRTRNTVSGIAIDHIVFESETDGVFDPNLSVYWVSQDYRFRVKRAGSVAATARYYSQLFTYAQLTAGGTVATITENGGTLPSAAAITVLIDAGGGAFLFTTAWSASGSDIVLSDPLPTGGRLLVNFVILPDGTTAYRQAFTGLTTNTVTVTANGGVLPANNAAITVHLNGVYTTEYTRIGAEFTLPYSLSPDWQLVVTFYV